MTKKKLAPTTRYRILYGDLNYRCISSYSCFNKQELKKFIKTLPIDKTHYIVVDTISNEIVEISWGLSISREIASENCGCENYTSYYYDD